LYGIGFFLRMVWVAMWVVKQNNFELKLISVVLQNIQKTKKQYKMKYNA
jgi:hypothetical protein